MACNSWPNCVGGRGESANGPKPIHPRFKLAGDGLHVYCLTNAEPIINKREISYRHTRGGLVCWLAK